MCVSLSVCAFMYTQQIQQTRAAAARRLDLELDRLRQETAALQVGVRALVRVFVCVQ